MVYHSLILSTKESEMEPRTIKFSRAAECEQWTVEALRDHLATIDRDAIVRVCNFGNPTDLQIVVVSDDGVELIGA